MDVTPDRETSERDEGVRRRVVPGETPMADQSTDERCRQEGRPRCVAAVQFVPQSEKGDQEQNAEKD